MADKPCALICSVPPSLQTDWGRSLPEFVTRFRPAAIIVDAPCDAQLVLAAKPLELAVLLRGDIELAKAVSADGVYLSGGAGQVESARATLGSAAIIGAASPWSRHDAMERAEAGADFIAFKLDENVDFAQAAELLAWWDEITQVPSAIEFDAEFPAASVLAQSHADFLIVEETGQAGESLTFATELGLQSGA